VPSTFEAPSGVKFSDVNINSNGNDGFANLADNTGGGFPRLPSNIALGTLSGLLGLAVTYSAEFGPIVSSIDSPDFRLTNPLTYVLSSGVDAEVTAGDSRVVAIDEEMEITAARREGIDAHDVSFSCS
jgi:hypothetical protein